MSNPASLESQWSFSKQDDGLIFLERGSLISGGFQCRHLNQRLMLDGEHPFSLFSGLAI